MILMIIVGIYALAAGKIRFTRNFQLVGTRARSYGATLLALALPATVGVNLIIRPLLPFVVLSNGVLLSIVNVLFLAAVMLGLALLFRNREILPSAHTPPAPGSEPPSPE